MTRAVTVSVRYETRDKNGENRRERNARFGQDDKTPELEIPFGGELIWEWFWDLNRERGSGTNGPEPISLIHIKTWSDLTGNTIRPDEVEILRAMDEAYRNQMQIEQEDAAAREGA